MESLTRLGIPELWPVTITALQSIQAARISKDYVNNAYTILPMPNSKTPECCQVCQAFFEQARYEAM